VRSPREIAFRLRQELVNASRAAHSPVFRPRAPLSPERIFPDPAACAELARNSAFAAAAVSVAESVLAHRFPLFGQIIETEPKIDWRRDYKNEKSSGAVFFRRVPYLNFQAVGDHKWIWELNRHQYLVTTAQAFLLTGCEEFLREIERQIQSWIEWNPFVRGMNWTSALEVAFRALSWVWIDHLAGSSMSTEFRIALQSSLWLHALHLEANLSIYFSPNTHLLGEALALHAIGRMYPGMPRAEQFVRRGGEIVERQLDFQIRPDGSHFEQSTYYHVYALDMFLLYYVIAGRPPRMNATLRRMAEYLYAIAGPSRRLFSSGDDDGGRLFHPYGERDAFCRATLATCAKLFPDLGFEYCDLDVLEQAAWWVGPGASGSSLRRTERAPQCAFADSGMVVLRTANIHLLFDAGPFGWGGAGHSHADTLNLLIRRGDDPILNDPGTFTYVADAAARNWFRGTAAHNTVRLDQRDQADPVKPFRWENKPGVKLNGCGKDFADAECAYRGFTHRRRVLLCGDRACIVVDDIHGPEDEHVIEQFWNISADVSLVTSEPFTTESGWRSGTYGSRTQTSRKVVRRRSPLPLRLVAAVVFEGSDATLEIPPGDPLTVRVAGIEAMFARGANPEWRFQ
jgi:hypothetical protein